MSDSRTYTFSAQLWLYSGEKSSWHFITVPEDIASDIADQHVLHTRGFGSLRVTVTIGKTTWQTSIFPDKKANSYLLPIKAAVRESEELQRGDEVQVLLHVVR